MKNKYPKKHRLDFGRPLLIIEVENGMLACGYLNVQTFINTEEACVIISGVSSFKELKKEKVKKLSDISYKARAMGVKPGDTGKKALAKMSGSSQSAQ